MASTAIVRRSPNAGQAVCGKLRLPLSYRGIGGRPGSRACQKAILSGTFLGSLASPVRIWSALYMIRDNDDPEQYRLNAITLDVPGTAPELASLALFALGALGLAAARRRPVRRDR